MDTPIRLEGMPWTLLRRSPQLTDTLLLADTRQWLAALPSDIRPVLLPLDFPRIANALVLDWSDRSSAILRLEDLLTDKRGGRQGFPPLVHYELERLLDVLTTR